MYFESILSLMCQNGDLFLIFSDLDLIAVAKHITTDFELEDIGVRLGLRKNHIRSIRTNNLHDINQAAFEVLQIWKGSSFEMGFRTQQMKEELKKVLLEMGMPTMDILS